MQVNNSPFTTNAKADASSAIKLSPGVQVHYDFSYIPSIENYFAPAALDKLKGSLWGIYIGDALAMPTHWYYDQSHLKRTYGQITGYVKPQDKLPGSIMSLSNTGGGGRGSNSGELVGGVILHGKKKYWERGADWFYHRGMAAGVEHGRLLKVLPLISPPSVLADVLRHKVSTYEFTHVLP